MAARTRRARRRPPVATRARVTMIGLLLAIVFALRIVIADPAVGASLLALAPIMLGSYWFGRTGGLLVALTAELLYVVTAPLAPQPQLLTAVALRFIVFCGVAIAFARLLEERGRLTAAVASRDEELAELRALRSALIPADVPDRPQLELASVFAPAAGSVSGDFYLVAEGPENATVVVVGDVVGKGIEAARRASFVRAALATFSDFTDDPCRLLELANAVLIERAGTSSNFVTAVCASVRPGDPLVRWAMAGHPPPMRLDDGAPLDGVRPGVPLGIEVELQCEQAVDPARSRAGRGHVHRRADRGPRERRRTQWGLRAHARDRGRRGRPCRAPRRGSGPGGRGASRGGVAGVGGRAGGRPLHRGPARQGLTRRGAPGSGRMDD